MSAGSDLTLDRPSSLRQRIELPEVDLLMDDDRGADRLAHQKLEMRKLAQKQRTDAEALYGDRTLAGTWLLNSFMARCPLPQGLIVAGYWPSDGEIDPRPLLHALHDRGHPIALPVIMARSTPLRFRLWHPGDLLTPGKFAIPVPPDTNPEVTPGALLVPLLAFDRQGYRLGRGMGFYDRTLQRLRETAPVLSLGVAYAAQEVPNVPHDAFDQRLDWVVTERYAFPSSPSNDPLSVFRSLR